MLRENYTVLLVAALFAAVYGTPGERCGPPPLPKRGGIEGGARNYYELGEYAEYLCDYGYEIESDGSTATVCIYSASEGAHWNNPPPVCKAAECSDLDNPDNGQVFLSGTTIGATASYSCSAGYELIGDRTRTCQSNGQWSGGEPSCKIVDCGAPEIPQNGRTNIPEGTAVGSKAWYFCNQGYVLLGAEFRTCQENGQWIPDAPICIPEPPLCGDLRVPDKGLVDISGTSPGSTATYSCIPGYLLIGGDVIRTCQDNGAWSGRAPYCRLIDCGFLSAPLYGRIDIRRTTFDSFVEYSCNVGFFLVGDRTRTCQLNGRWSGELPICKPVDCGPLDYPNKGGVSLSGTTVGSVATYSCEAGYALDGDVKRECLPSGVWSGTAPTCIIVDCGGLPAPMDGTVKLTGTHFGDKASYFCNPGFILEGDSTRECETSGEWSGAEPVCKPIFCPKLHPPINGVVRVREKTVGSRAMYECFAGHALFGNEYRTCLPDGEWSGDEPVCRFVDCGRLKDPENGQVAISGTDFGSNSRYRCLSGYILVGDDMRMCQENGYWSGEEPVCRFLGCSYLDPPTNGQVILSGKTVDSIATYTCDAGFTLVGKSSERRCQRNGEWSGSAPFCRPRAVQCPYLADPTNGRVSLSGSTVGATATYTCNKGFILSGNERRICQSNGEWDGVAPICTREPPVSCGFLPYPSNGRVALTGVTVGSTAFYACNAGFLLVGDERRTCQSNGQWSGSEPRCFLVDCGDLDDPENGQVVLTGTVFRSTATYSCNVGYILVGEQTRTCQANGDWSGRAPVCEPIDCGNLEDPTNGLVTLTGTIINSKATYSCNDGYFLVGIRVRICQFDGEWSGKAPKCEPVDCRNLRDPQNGKVSLTGTTFGSTASYTCNEGFILLGEQTRTCQENSLWSGQAPTCISVECPVLDDPENGRVDLPSTTVGSTATYSCDDGYRLVGEETRTCLDNGEWSGIAPFCRPVDCGVLDDPENGEVSLTGTILGSKATYSCNSGYVLEGESTRVCQSNRKWSGEAPTCEPVDCGDLRNPRKGRVVLTGTVFRSTASYICNAGYILVGTETRTCQANGEWSGTAPFCRPVDCGVLDDPENGEVSLTGTILGSKATYSCNSGYVLEGESTRVCQSNGKWSGEAPTCEPVDCGDLRNPRKGRVALTGTVFRSTASYICNAGYILVGTETRTCQANGEWSGTAPFCRPVDCGVLDDPENGEVSLTGTILGSKATYSCNNGYVLEGESTRVCQSNRKWSGEAPTCEPVDCGDLRNPRKGRVVLTGTVFRSTASYSCNFGYILVGTETRTCQANGEWSGTAPFCRPVDCGVLDDPENGEVSLTGTILGSKATYSCNSGYVLEGESTRVCQSNGKWSGEAPTCEPVDCGDLRNPRKGRVALTGTVFRSTASYICNAGYILVGTETRTCQANGEWSGTAPFCRPVDCGVLDDPENGEVSLTGTILGSKATYSCNNGYVLEGESTRVCQSNRKWSGEAPTCEPVDCGDLRNPRKGRVVLTGTVFRSTASYSCNFGYILVGTETRTCQANGEWSGTAPFCRRVVCGSLDNPENGQVSLTGTTVGSKAIYSCNKGFVLDGNSRRTCQINGKWSGEAPVCKALTCESLEAPVNGQIRVRGTSVGSVALYTCNSGFMLEGDAFRTCQGNGEWSGEEPTCIRISCRTLRPSKYGLLYLTGTRVGDTATYSCLKGFVLVGVSVRECLKTGVWSGVAPQCKIPQCGNLPNPANGRVTLTGTTVGSEATYTCNRGYTLWGDQTRWCRPGGQWSGSEPTCESKTVNCGFPTAPRHGYARVFCTTFGCRTTHWCRDGYRMYGDRVRICQSSGQWSGAVPTCKYY